MNPGDRLYLFVPWIFYFPGMLYSVTTIGQRQGGMNKIAKTFAIDACSLTKCSVVQIVNFNQAFFIIIIIYNFYSA